MYAEGIILVKIKNPGSPKTVGVFVVGAPSGTRTRGPLIKSQLLYHLS